MKRSLTSAEKRGTNREETHSSVVSRVEKQAIGDQANSRLLTFKFVLGSFVVFLRSEPTLACPPDFFVVVAGTTRVVERSLPYFGHPKSLSALQQQAEDEQTNKQVGGPAESV